MSSRGVVPTESREMRGGKGEARGVTQQRQPRPRDRGTAQLWGSRPSVLQQWGAAAGEGKERAQSCTKSAKAERAAHTQTAVNGTIYIPQGEMTKHHRFL